MSYLKSHMPCASNDKKTKPNSSFMVSNLFHFLFTDLANISLTDMLLGLDWRM